MHLIIIQLQRQSPPFLAQFIFFIGRPHNEARINTSNVSSFNWLLRSLFIQLCLKNSSTRIVKLAKLKFQSVPSWSSGVKIVGVIGILKCMLECQDWSPTMLLFTNCSHSILWHAVFGKAFTVKAGNFAKHVFVKCPKNKTKKLIWQALKTSMLKPDSDLSVQFEPWNWWKFCWGI